MLAETRDEAFTKKGWLFELKLDGYRLLADHYVRGIRKLVGEACVPSVELQCEWIEDVANWILRIDVLRGADGPYQLREDHRFLIRRGATNRSMSKSELEIHLRR